MGRIIPFRRRRRRELRFWPDDDPVTLRGVARETIGWLRVFRPFILLGILVSIWVGMDPALVEPPAVFSGEPETVSASFTRCGPGRGHACVTDGDTFKLGKRRVRLIGIDAPEVKARCDEEARLAEQATARLQALLSEGPFEMSGWAHNRRDRYDRELMAVTRSRPDGSEQSIADEMRESGLARRYAGGFRGGWC